jgi:hypothetical protein
MNSCGRPLNVSTSVDGQGPAAGLVEARRPILQSAVELIPGAAVLHEITLPGVWGRERVERRDQRDTMHGA